QMFEEYYRLNASRELALLWELSTRVGSVSGSATFAQSVYEKSRPQQTVFAKWAALDSSFDSSSSIKHDQLRGKLAASDIHKFLIPSELHSLLRSYAGETWPNEELWLFMGNEWLKTFYFRPLQNNLSDAYSKKLQAYILLLLLEQPPVRI